MVMEPQPAGPCTPFASTLALKFRGLGFSFFFLWVLWGRSIHCLGTRASRVSPHINPMAGAAVDNLNPP